MDTGGTTPRMRKCRRWIGETLGALPVLDLPGFKNLEGLSIGIY
jgi:hypothetical protein